MKLTTVMSQKNERILPQTSPDELIQRDSVCLFRCLVILLKQRYDCDDDDDDDDDSNNNNNNNEIYVLLDLLKSVIQNFCLSTIVNFLLLLLIQPALQPLVGFGLLYDFIPQSSIFALLSPISHFHLLIATSHFHPYINALFTLWSSFLFYIYRNYSLEPSHQYRYL
jgi:hypothetical protein